MGCDAGQVFVRSRIRCASSFHGKPELSWRGKEVAAGCLTLRGPLRYNRVWRGQSPFAPAKAALLSRERKATIAGCDDSGCQGTSAAGGVRRFRQAAQRISIHAYIYQNGERIARLRFEPVIRCGHRQTRNRPPRAYDASSWSARVGGISDFSELMLPPDGRGERTGTDCAAIDKDALAGRRFQEQKMATSSPLVLGCRTGFPPAEDSSLSTAHEKCGLETCPGAVFAAWLNAPDGGNYDARLRWAAGAISSVG